MHELWSKALAATQQGSRYCFATILEATTKGTPRKAGAKMLVFEDGSSWGTIGGGRYEKDAISQCLKAIRTQQPKIVTYQYFGRSGESVCGGQMKVFIEPIAAQLRLAICGAGHIALPLSVIATMLGFYVVIIDNRKAFANKNRFPHVDQIFVGDHAKHLGRLEIDPLTFVAIVTQGNEFDFKCLKAVVNSPAGYIGVISSRAKRVKFLRRLKEEGASEAVLKRVHIPMGIDLGAQTPEEIAVSICAEMVAVKNKDFLGTDKFHS